ncbi:hypothetical protein [Paracoccus sp. S3-43]|uniref:hypothetical protein n=1 Tax=Paracoccus sp. S3-43 TaxID=3030011 RepID=UPI0023B0FE0E|nr:hypothetical protein [Paracoccus sp. S3-43]WEF25602.1 hypothetical protein PXD02_06710 [Paracoccus sp. S3-43]
MSGRGLWQTGSRPPVPAVPARQAAVGARGMTAEALRLMLAMKGRAWGGQGGATPCALPEPLPEPSTDPLALLVETATAGIDDPRTIRAETAWLALAVAAARHLDQVMAARNPRDLDLAIHQLRTALLRILRRSGLNVGPDLRDAALAPVLWRMAVLDRAFGSYLGIGLDPLARRAALLLARHDGGRILGETAARQLVDSLRAEGAFIARPEARCDWSRALGPAGRA